MFCTLLFKCNEVVDKSLIVMPLAGLHDSLDPWQRIPIREEEVNTYIKLPYSILDLCFSL
jgi:hypothetical protein